MYKIKNVLSKEMPLCSKVLIQLPQITLIPAPIPYKCSKIYM